MTKVLIDPGICGFKVEVTVEKTGRHDVTIRAETECEMVMAMMEEIQETDMRTAFTGHLNNPVYRAAAMHLKHPACPVSSGILKAVEVELGLCLARDVSIEFVKE